jgi:hypothetical protein
MEHYNWGAKLKTKNKLILTGPTDFELTSTTKINSIGYSKGLIMLNVDSREEAVGWAEKDPFPVNSYRKNNVHSLKITITKNSIPESLKKPNNNHEHTT